MLLVPNLVLQRIPSLILCTFSKLYILLTLVRNANNPLLYKGICVWKAKPGSIGSSSTVMDIQPTKPEPDSHTPDLGPGKSFRNFRFDTALILQAMEASFSS